MGGSLRSAGRCAASGVWWRIASAALLLAALCGVPDSWWVAALVALVVLLLGCRHVADLCRRDAPPARTGGLQRLIVRDEFLEPSAAKHDRAARPSSLGDVPFTPIGRIRDGQLAKFVGQVHLAEQEPLVAPLSGRRCAYYRARVGVVVAPQLFGGRKRRYRTVAEETQSQRFFVEDPTGRALVVVERPRVLVTLRGGFARHRSTRWRLEAFAQRYGQRIGSDELRYEEGLLVPGEPVAVYGRCQWVPDPDPAAHGGHYRARPRRLIVDAPVRIASGGLGLD